jgi:hypothetical protein
MDENPRSEEHTARQLHAAGSPQSRVASVAVRCAHFQVRLTFGKFRVEKSTRFPL